MCAHSKQVVNSVAINSVVVLFLETYGYQTYNFYLNGIKVTAAILLELKGKESEN